MLSLLCRAVHPTSINLLGKEREIFRVSEMEMGRGKASDVPGIGEFGVFLWSFRKGIAQLKLNWQAARLSSTLMGNLLLTWPDENFAF